MTSWPSVSPLLLMPPFYPFAARGPLTICHGPQGGHLAHFGKPGSRRNTATRETFKVVVVVTLAQG